MTAIKTKIYKQKTGAALAFIITVLAVLTIFSLVVVQLVYSNLLQAKFQERKLQAYYLALSSNELCLTALLQQGSGGETDTLLYDYFNPTISSPPTLTDTLTLDGGTVSLTVRAISRNSERWIEIQSVATLNDSSTTGTKTLQFQYSNPLVKKEN